MDGYRFKTTGEGDVQSLGWRIGSIAFYGHIPGMHSTSVPGTGRTVAFLAFGVLILALARFLPTFSRNV